MASLLINPKLQFFDDNGDPLVGGKLYAYEAGTSTPQDTYTDQAGASPNDNPIILDSRGECSVWLDDANYKFTLYDADDNLIWTEDNVSTFADASVTTDKIADEAVTTAKIEDEGVTTAKIADLNVTAAKLANNAVTVSKLPDVNYGITDSSGTFTNASGETDVTNLSQEITTNGRPVLIFLQPYWASVVDASYIGASDTSSAGATAYIGIYRDSTQLADINLGVTIASSGSPSIQIPPGSVTFLDEPSAGTYTYKITASQASGDLISVYRCKLVVVEL